MQNYLNNTKTVKRLEALAFILLAVNFCLLIGYQFDGYLTQFHSDSAHRILLGNEAFKHKSIFPSDWSYVNRDLYILYGHVLVAPLMLFMKPGYTAYAVSGLLNALVFLAILYLLLKELNTKKSVIYLTLAVVCGGISGFMAENLFGQITYGNLISISMSLLLLVYWFLFRPENHQKYRVYAVIYLALVTAYISSNPFRGFVYYAVPTFMALGFFSLSTIDHNTLLFRRRVLQLLGLTILGIAFGIPLHLYILSGVNNYQGTSAALWLTYEQSMSNIMLTGKGLLAIMGGAPTPGISVTSGLGLYEASRLLAAITFLILIPMGIKRMFLANDPRMKIYNIYAITGFGIVLFVQIFTTVPVMSDPVISSRYLIPPFFLLLVCAYIRPSFDGKNLVLTITTVTVMLFSVLTAYPNYFKSLVNSSFNSDGTAEVARRQNLIDFLKENNLSYGYASYWNAGINSVLSDGDVLIRQVLFEKGLPAPYRHHAADSWYYANAWKGKTFLLLAPGERKQINVGAISQYGIQLTAELKHGGYDILVFDKNLAAALPAWDLTYENGVTFKASTESFKQIGHVATDQKTGNTLLVAQPGDIGALHFGPYIYIAPGKYRAIFHIEGFTADRDVARIEVSTAPGQKVMAERVLRSSSGEGEILEFEVQKRELIEFRMWALGGATLAFSSVSIERIP